jgi:NitT/TauT family transport system substrate-binding protein
MLHRRSVIQASLAALGTLSAYAPGGLRAQNKPLVEVRYNEVVHSVLYAPAYVAMTNGYFKDAGLDVEMTTANGGDKSMAALISGGADIALIGPETAIYVLNSDSSTKARIFCGLTSTDGFMLVGRARVDKFDWSVL